LDSETASFESSYGHNRVGSVYRATEVTPFCKTIVVVKRKQADGEFQKNGFN